MSPIIPRKPALPSDLLQMLDPRPKPTFWQRMLCKLRHRWIMQADQTDYIVGSTPQVQVRVRWFRNICSRCGRHRGYPCCGLVMISDLTAIGACGHPQVKTIEVGFIGNPRCNP